ncbi:MAG: TrkH family potassium uptake protein [candidate division WOR-3 bacterium]|nr:TrkH family potassium uptake protein [candidate division WOR-3 bacterium]
MARLASQVNPGRLLVFGYLSIIIVGALLLYLPIASKNISLIDAFYTATSAVCVTGLIVRDTATDFTLFGKLIILLLIQIGGIGYMTLSTTFFFFLRQKLSLRDRLVAKESFNVFTYDNLKRFGFTVLRVTLVFEALGALALFIYFLHYTPMKIFYALGHAIFHSVSAFCNAGFSTFSENLTNYSTNYFVLLTISFLFICGGIGFVVISDLYKTYVKKINNHLSLHTKTVLTTTLILIVVGTLLILLLEWRGSLRLYPTSLKILNAYFHAVTARTAGFNTLSLKIFHPATLLFIIVLMFIGASPGGTGGGVKTTTFSIILLQIKALLTGQSEIFLYRRRVAQEQIFKAFLIVGLAISWLLTSLILLLIFNKPDMNILTCLFELFSAFGTVGLSRGSEIMTNLSASYDFTVLGKLVIILTMLIGRVGILTLATALIRKKIISYSYPEGVILVG